MKYFYSRIGQSSQYACIKAEGADEPEKCVSLATE